MRDYIGIDPGLSGGIALMINGKLWKTLPMPVIQFDRRKTVDIVMLSMVLKDASTMNTTVVIEAAQKFSAGTNALTSTWFGYGRITAMLELMEIRHHIISSPKTWQKEFWARPKLPKGTKFDTKEASINACRRLWPSHDFTPTERSVKSSDGLTDAALIAEYGRRKSL